MQEKQFLEIEAQRAPHRGMAEIFDSQSTDSAKKTKIIVALIRFFVSWLVTIACLPLRLFGMTVTPLTWQEAKNR